AHRRRLGGPPLGLRPHRAGRSRAAARRLAVAELTERCVGAGPRCAAPPGVSGAACRWRPWVEAGVLVVPSRVTAPALPGLARCSAAESWAQRAKTAWPHIRQGEPTRA